MSELRQKILEGVPYYGMDRSVPKAELERLGKGVEEATAAAHEALYLGHAERDPRVVVLDDAASEYTGQFITFADGEGRPCYGAWDAENAATDIGIRGVNPYFPFDQVPPKERPNFITVVHGDMLAAMDYQRRRVPRHLVDALDAVALFNGFIVEQVAKPYLAQVAEAFGKDPEAYVAKFYPKDRRSRTLTRAILYHLNAPPGMRQVSQIDGAELLIKEHKDKCAYTIDALQSSPGLQYLVDGIWRDARTEIACFRSAGDDELAETDKGSLTPPTFHRAVAREDLPSVVSPELARRGIARIALPVFVNLSTKGVRDVPASSDETHSTNA